VPPTLPALTLSVGCVMALGWSLASWSTYRGAWRAPFLHSTLSDIVANGLLTILFLAIGLELSEELHTGPLRDWRHAVAPLAGAVGGMVATALLSVVAGLTLASPSLVRGWGVPMATDVAFVIAALALCGSGLPREVRVFLLTLAIADDVGSLVALGVAGSVHAHVVWLVVAFAVGGLAWLGRSRGPVVPLVLLVPLWLSLSAAGTEPALAGVVIGACVLPRPATLPLERFVQWLTALVVLPLFALSACGVNWQLLRWTGTSMTPLLALVVVRLVGKTVGIGGAVLVVRAVGGPVVQGLRGHRLTGAALLCAMGFTVPLLFARVVFTETAPVVAPITVALVVATVMGGLGGVFLLRRGPRSEAT